MRASLKAAIIHYYYGQGGGNAGGGGGSQLKISAEPGVEFTGAEIRSSRIGMTNMFYTPESLWYNGKTYFCYQGIYQNAKDGFGQAHIIEYDEKDGVKRPYRLGSTLPSANSHTIPVMHVGIDGTLYIFQERVHDSSIDIYKGDLNFMSLLGNKIGSELSYCQMIRLENGKGVLWSRGDRLTGSEDTGYELHITKATSGFDTWDAPIKINLNPNPIPFPGVGARHYPQLPMYRQRVGDYYYLVATQRNDVEENPDDGAHSKWYVLKTHKDSFTTFENIVGDPFSYDVVAGGPMEAELENFKYFDLEDTTKNGFVHVCALGPDGEFFSINGDGTEDLFLNIIINRELTRKALSIPNYAKISPDDAETHLVRHLYYDGKTLEVIMPIDNGENVRMHLLRSTDFGDNWTDLGDIFPEYEGDFNGVVTLPYNYHKIPNNRNFAVAFWTRDDSTSNSKGVVVKRAAKGDIQCETPRIVVAASNLSDEYDLFRYRATAGDIVNSGTNVSQATDLFGLRNALGVNNPQWDGINEIAFNGTNNYFSIPATGLTALTKATFFVVVRSNATAAMILAMTDNTAEDKLIQFGITNTTFLPFFAVRPGGGPTWSDLGGDAIGDNNLHLIVFVVDGRCKCDIYIDGKKQFYSDSGFLTISDYAKRGRLDSVSGINSVRIGSQDRVTDLYSAFSFREMILKHNVYDYDTQRGIEKKLADDHGITLNYGYQ